MGSDTWQWKKRLQREAKMQIKIYYFTNVIYLFYLCIVNSNKNSYEAASLCDKRGNLLSFINLRILLVKFLVHLHLLLLNMNRNGKVMHIH